MDPQAFITWLKNQPYYGPGFQREEAAKVARLNLTLERFRQHLAGQGSSDRFEDTTLEALQSFDFHDKDDDDTHLSFLFGFLGRKDLQAYVGEVAARKYFRRKTLAAVFNAMPELAPAVKAMQAGKLRLASDLLEQGATPAGRQALAKRFELPEETVLEMVKCCDLCRMTGMSGQALRRSIAMGYDSLEKFKSETPDGIRGALRGYLQETGERAGGDMLDYAWFIDQARRLPDAIKEE